MAPNGGYFLLKEINWTGGKMAPNDEDFLLKGERCAVIENFTSVFNSNIDKSTKEIN
jgi:hypothetical protein